MTTYSQYNVPNVEEMVNFGVGQPDTNSLPLDWFKSTLTSMGVDIQNPEFLQYHSIPGYHSLRHSLAIWLTKKYYQKIMHIEVEEMLDVLHSIKANQIFMTNGNTGALQLIMNTMMETGDEIIIEEPTYFIAKKMFEEYGLEINSVPMLNDGLDINVLKQRIEEIIEKTTAYPQKKIFLYTIPIHHNPTSITMSHQKRKQLAELCEQYPNFYIIADEVYHFLSFDDNEPVYPLADYHPNILSLGSFSKILSPALRVGWIYHNNSHSLIQEEGFLLDDLKNSAYMDSGGGLNPLGFMMIEYALKNNQIDTILEKNINMLKNRCNVMTEYLKMFPNINFEVPSGGYFLWLKLNVDTNKFLDFCIHNQVKFHPGYKFGKNCDYYLRLSFSFYKEEDILIGLERLTNSYEIYKKIKIGMIGSTGKLGKLIVNEINNNKNYLLHNQITHDMNIDPMIDVIVDVSSKDGTKNLLASLANKSINKPLIIGTTGLDSETIKDIKKYSINNPVALISNFSEGISKIKKMIVELNKLGITSSWSFDILEKHHIHKKDSPSGTAKTLAELIDNKCPIESLRDGDIIGYHEIHAKSEDEEIKIIHNAKSRNIFAKGCMKYIPWILKKKAGLYYEIDDDIPPYVIYSGSGNIIMVTEVIESDNYNNFIKEQTQKYSKLDGIIFINIRKNQDTIWQYYNRDGSMANFCGNGARCVGKYLNDYHQIKNGKIINTSQIITTFNVSQNNIVTVEMPNPVCHDLMESYTNDLTMLIQQLTPLTVKGISNFTVGVPHLVLEINEKLDNIDKDIINTIGTIINSGKSFDSQYNIDFINIDTIKNTIRLRTFERGVDRETNACGSGCIAAFDYYAYVKDHAYSQSLETNIILNNESVTVKYINGKYYLKGQVSKITLE